MSRPNKPTQSKVQKDLADAFAKHAQDARAAQAAQISQAAWAAQTAKLYGEAVAAENLSTAMAAQQPAGGMTPPALISVHVCSASGLVLTVQAEQDNSVLALKGMIAEQWKVPVECQRLLTSAVVMADESQLITHCGLHAEVFEVSLVVTYERLLSKLAEMQPKAYDILVQWVRDDYARASFPVQMLLDQTDALVTHVGYMPRGNDIVVETMTVDQAKMRCLTLPTCMGFTFRIDGDKFDPKRDAVLVHFKSKGCVKETLGPCLRTPWMSLTFSTPQNRGRGVTLRATFKEAELRLLCNRAKNGNEVAMDEMAKSLMDSSGALALSAAKQMASVGTREACGLVVAALSKRLADLKTLSTDTEDATALQMVKVLATCATKGDEDVIAVCIACLREDTFSHGSARDAGLRVCAAKTLASTAPKGHEAAIETLCQLLTGRPKQMECFVKALSQLAPQGHQSAIDAMKVLVADAHPGGHAEKNYRKTLASLEEPPARPPGVFRVPQSGGIDAHNGPTWQQPPTYMVCMVPVVDMIGPVRADQAQLDTEKSCAAAYESCAAAYKSCAAAYESCAGGSPVGAGAAAAAAGYSTNSGGTVAAVAARYSSMELLQDEVYSD